jgi:N-acetylglucosamine malate deacetylase 1
MHLLALAAHPDDVELCAGGTICSLTNRGYDVGIVDFTRGELGSRGTPEGRLQEADEAGRILGIKARENLGIADGNIENSPENREKVVRVIRRYRPHIVLINPLECRHPDHGKAAQLAIDAMFAAGLRKVETFEGDGTPQEPHRPHHVLHYMQAIDFNATFVVDVSDVWEQRTAALKAFRSQFHNPDYQPADDEPDTFVSNPAFFEWIESRARTYGYRIGATYGEPLLYRHGPVGVQDLVSMLSSEKRFR